MKTSVAQWLPGRVSSQRAEMIVSPSTHQLKWEALCCLSPSGKLPGEWAGVCLEWGTWEEWQGLSLLSPAGYTAPLSLHA